MSVYDFDGLLGNNEDELPLFEEGDENQDEENLIGNPAATDGIKVELPKKRVRNPRPRLTAESLQGPRGLHVIEDYFKNYKFKGKGYEAQDLDEIMRRMQHWGHRLYPNYKFDDVLNTIERLGRKKPVQFHMSRYRLGLLEDMLTEEQLAAETVRLNDDDNVEAVQPNEPLDEFDVLLDQQIAMSRLDPRTPAAKVRPEPRTPATNSTTLFHNQAQSTPYASTNTETPKMPAKPKFTAEQLARMEENKRIAKERLAAKRAQQQQQQIVEEMKRNVVIKRSSLPPPPLAKIQCLNDNVNNNKILTTTTITTPIPTIANTTLADLTRMPKLATPVNVKIVKNNQIIATMAPTTTTLTPPLLVVKEDKSQSSINTKLKLNNVPVEKVTTTKVEKIATETNKLIDSEVKDEIPMHNMKRSNSILSIKANTASSETTNCFSSIHSSTSCSSPSSSNTLLDAKSKRRRVWQVPDLATDEEESVNSYDSMLDMETVNYF